MTDEPQRSRGPLIALLAGVVVVVVIALIAVFARGGTVSYDEDSPEGVVQRYTQAVMGGDITTAMTHLNPEIAENCEREPASDSGYRVALLDTDVREDTARVRVMVTRVYDSSPFGAGEYRSEEVFDLVRVGGTWYVDSAPWLFTVCYPSEPR